MEDLWDETIFEEPLKPAPDTSLNIPAIMDNFSSVKAAKKALKKARKEAKRFTSSSSKQRRASDKIMYAAAEVQKNNSSGIKVGDIVWAKHSDWSWWPAKISAAGSSSGDQVQVHWFNQHESDTAAVKIQLLPNLIKPFMEMIRVSYCIYNLWQCSSSNMLCPFVVIST